MGTDQSGNVGTYILDQPIDTQGLAPRARIRGFQPLSENPPANAGQTALRNNRVVEVVTRFEAGVGSFE